jgi:hypothetical protein
MAVMRSTAVHGRDAVLQIGALGHVQKLMPKPARPFRPWQSFEYVHTARMIGRYYIASCTAASILESKRA